MTLKKKKSTSENSDNILAISVAHSPIVVAGRPVSGSPSMVDGVFSHFGGDGRGGGGPSCAQPAGHPAAESRGVSRVCSGGWGGRGRFTPSSSGLPEAPGLWAGQPVSGQGDPADVGAAPGTRGFSKGGTCGSELLFSASPPSPGATCPGARNGAQWGGVPHGDPPQRRARAGRWRGSLGASRVVFSSPSSPSCPPRSVLSRACPGDPRRRVGGGGRAALAGLPRPRSSCFCFKHDPLPGVMQSAL